MSRLLSVVMSSWSWARSMTPKSPAQSQDHAPREGTKHVPRAGTGRSSRLGLPRPLPVHSQSFSGPAGETLAPRLLPRLSLHFPFGTSSGLLFHAVLRQMHPHNTLESFLFSWNFWGPARAKLNRACPLPVFSRCCSAAFGTGCQTIAAAVTPCACLTKLSVRPNVVRPASAVPPPL